MQDEMPNDIQMKIIYLLRKIIHHDSNGNNFTANRWAWK